jgi:hypothetical protein
VARNTKHHKGDRQDEGYFYFDSLSNSFLFMRGYSVVHNWQSPMSGNLVINYKTGNIFFRSKLTITYNKLRTSKLDFAQRFSFTEDYFNSPFTVGDSLGFMGVMVRQWSEFKEENSYFHDGSSHGRTHGLKISYLDKEKLIMNYGYSYVNQSRDYTISELEYKRID